MASFNELFDPVGVANFMSEQPSGVEKVGICRACQHIGAQIKEGVLMCLGKEAKGCPACCFEGVGVPTTDIAIVLQKISNALNDFDAMGDWCSDGLTS